MFQGEMTGEGQDAGGMEKEWFTLMAQEFLNPDNGKIPFPNPSF